MSPRSRPPFLLATAAILTLLFSHCGTAPAAAPITETELGPNASIIRNPVDQSFANVDTVNVARLVFREELYEFDPVNAGKVIKHNFAFTNTGLVPLLITSARSTCGCTVPRYPTGPIPPGGSGVVEIAFDTKNKSGYQNKPVTITANTYPAATTIFVAGRVDNK